MRKTAKKGFTIVELVIVIAVVAVLAAVLIPTFVSLVSKANNSADMQMIANINKWLAATELTEGNNETMHEAVQDAKAAGYDLTKLTATNTILWNEKTDRFLAVNGTKTIASADNEKYDDDKKAQYWIVSEEINDTYSTYYIGTDTNIELPYSLGFDAGDKVVTVTYKGEADDIRINGVFEKLTMSNAQKPVISGYVYELGNSGNVRANNVLFHQAESEISTRVENVGGTVKYGVHYDADGNGKCDFTVCGKDVCDHQMKVENSKEAKCADTGYIYSKCEKCGATEFVVLDVLGHIRLDVAEVEPTCELPGQTAGWVCTREGCTYKEGVEMIWPLFHDVDDETGQCKRTGCPYYEKSVEEKIVDVTNLSQIDWKGQDKSKETIIIRLTQDITCTPEEFIAAFGSPNAPSWVYNSMVGGTEDSKYENVTTIYAIDIDLNGHTLTINGETVENGTFTRTQTGVEVYGHLRIRNKNGANGGLKLTGTSVCYKALLATVKTNATVTFKDVTVDADYNPVNVGIASKSNIIVTGSTLNIKKQYKTAMAANPDIIVKYYDTSSGTYVQCATSSYGDYRIVKSDGVYTGFYYYSASNKSLKGAVRLYIADADGTEKEISTDWIDTLGAWKDKGTYDPTECASGWAKVSYGKLEYQFQTEAREFYPIIRNDAGEINKATAPISFLDQNSNGTWYMTDKSNSYTATIDETSSVNHVD